jgi:Zn-dependent M28 family amino/carboxypeptidase
MTGTKTMLTKSIALAVGLICAASFAQAADAPFAKQEAVASQLRDKALKGSIAYDILESLTTEIGARPAGSPALLRAADWGVARMKALGYDKVTVESFKVPGWKRGAETAEVTAPYPQKLVITALGGSVATPAAGLSAPIALFKRYDDLLAQAPGSLTGKIAVVTEPIVRAQDGAGYGAGYRIRGTGASEAAKRGAVGYMLRSLGTDNHRVPHTGTMTYDPAVAKIPAAALSNPDADLLERMAVRGVPVTVKMVVTPTFGPDLEARTVVGEITGREAPQEVIVIGGHLDSWDLGTGAVDDGAGVAITMAAGKLILDQPVRPRRTVRVVLWGAEEIGKAGEAFAKVHGAEVANHVIGSESDFGAGPVLKISLPKVKGGDGFVEALMRALGPAGVIYDRQDAVNGGADNEEMAALGMPVASLRQNGLDYFDWHHTADDSLDKVKASELDQNVAVWSAFVWMVADSAANFRAAAK